MKQNKIFSIAVVLSMIAIFTMSWKPFHRSHKVKPVTITAVYDFSTFPNVLGNFTTGGGLKFSGTSTMNIHPYDNNTKANCDVLLVTSKGTITIHQHCNLAANFGKWEIISGTGAYEDLKGHGTLTMPPNTEAMTGVISWNREREDDDE